MGNRVEKKGKHYFESVDVAVQLAHYGTLDHMLVFKPGLLPKPHGHFRHQLTASSKFLYDVPYVCPSVHP